MADKTRVFITTLILVIVILAGIMVYAFVISPAISGYTVQNQQKGVQIAVTALLTQIQQNGYVQIPLGGNQVLTLIPPQLCSRLQQPTQPAQTVQTPTTPATGNQTA